LFYSIALLGAWRTGHFETAVTLFLEADIFLMIASLAVGMAVVGSLLIFGLAILLGKQSAADDSKRSEDA
jgi:hypothetical protein